MDDPIKNTEVDDKEILFETTLRPSKFEDYIGQDKIKRNLEIFIEAARARGDALDHVLFYGPPGLGKTTLANILASEMKANIKSTSGPVIEKSGDLAAILIRGVASSRERTAYTSGIPIAIRSWTGWLAYGASTWVTASRH